MKIRMFALAACLCGAAPLLAQDTTALAGSWQGEVQMPGGMIVEVMMRVEAAAVTWTASPRTRPRMPSPCLSRPLPTTLSEVAPGAFSIEIQASKVVPGCKDSQARVHLVDGRLLEGKFGDGRPLKLERR